MNTMKHYYSTHDLVVLPPSMIGMRPSMDYSWLQIPKRTKSRPQIWNSLVY